MLFDKEYDDKLKDIIDHHNILIVDDEESVLEATKILLKDKFTVFLAKEFDEVKIIFEKNTIDVVILDLLLPKVPGEKILMWLKEKDPCTEVIMHTVVKKDIDTIVKCLKLGAYNYLPKPADPENIESMVENAYSKCILHRTYALLDKKLGKEWDKTKLNKFTDYLTNLYETLVKIQSIL